jgi:large subunit ribosomal protein L7/L12
VGQLVTNGRLVWYSSYKCPFCGACIEADDEGLLPEEIKKVFIETEGLWNLVIKENEAKKAKIISIIRQALNLSLIEAGQLAKHIPGTIMHGTRAEMEWLQQLLAKDGFQTLVIRKM